MRRFEEINQQLPEGVRLVATSKGHSIQKIQQLYSEGCRIFGESRVQELLPKIEACPADIQWHLIGTLQRKKVRQVVGKVALIHSVDSLELAQKISAVSVDMGVNSAVLIQVNAAEEESKHGLSLDQCESDFAELISLPGLIIKGLMTMAPNTDDWDIVRRTFRDTRQLRDRLESRYGIQLPELSMGMSRDYLIAVEEGATLVRIGSLLFES